MSRQREARQKQAAKERRAENRKLAEAARARGRRHAQVKKVALRVGAAVAVIAVVVTAVVVVREVVRSGRIGPVNMASDGLLITGDGTIATAVPTDPIPADGSPTPHDISGRGAGVLDVVMYVDYGDPASAQFWQASGQDLVGAVTGGYLSLEIHPVALKARTAATPAPTADAADPAEDPAATEPTTDPAEDPAATEPTADPATDPAAAEPTAEPTQAATLGATDRDYARRAANTFACVAANVPDQALDVHDALLAVQPELDTEGLTDAELVDLVENAGVDSSDVRSCIGAHNFVDWVTEATDRAVATAPSPSDWRGSITATPTVVVAGQPYTGAAWDLEGFTSFLDTVYQSYVAASDPLDGTAPDDGTAPEETAPEETAPEETVPESP
ncbi:MAG: hypothetical protein LBU50_01885 [Cellulomonas sp.]|jgi:hypothetical protein|nr:hypothetical protein [Cellulomonas sp.]